jgi:hypothetical protein
LRRSREFAKRRSMNSRKTWDDGISYQISTFAFRLPRLESGYGRSRVKLILIAFIRSNWEMSLTVRRCWCVHTLPCKILTLSRYAAQQAHPQPVSTEHRATHT